MHEKGRTKAKENQNSNVKETKKERRKVKIASTLVAFDFRSKSLLVYKRNLARCIFFRSRLSIQVQYTPISRSVVLLLWFRAPEGRQASKPERAAKPLLQTASKQKQRSRFMTWKWFFSLSNHNKLLEQRKRKQLDDVSRNLWSQGWK